MWNIIEHNDRAFVVTSRGMVPVPECERQPGETDHAFQVRFGRMIAATVAEASANAGSFEAIDKKYGLASHEPQPLFEFNDHGNRMYCHPVASIK